MSDRLQLLDKYIVPEGNTQGETYFGIAHSSKDRLGRLRVTTEAYRGREYLADIPEVGLNRPLSDLINGSLEEFTIMLSELSGGYDEIFMEEGIVVYDLNGDRTDGIYIDPWEFQSIPIVAKNSKGEVVGSSRLIMANDPLPLPTLKTDRLVSPEFKEAVKQVPLEMSQLAKSDQVNELVKFGLFRIAIHLSREMGANEWLATTDSFVMRLLNGRLKFAIKEIGQTQNYLGSDSTPGWIKVDVTLNSVAENGDRNLADYLGGKFGVPGFETFISL
ncbi:hypothetical protein HYV12_04530 [Candidatus Dojkabacteria bacterium]|nr:hypothetical protein [Candidatus Dojkabacteria bacterium]